MRDYADDANLHARICAMRSRLLARKDYAALARDQSGGVSDKTAGLSDPASAEEIVFREQIAPILVIAEAVGRYTPLFLSFLRQFEAQNIKLLLTKFFDLQGLDEWHDIGPYATFDRNLLREADTLPAVSEHLKGTYLEEVFEDVSTYGQMETRVDLCVARDLYAVSDLFPAQAKLDYQALMDKRMAVVLTILSLRLRKTYQWDDGKIRSYLEKFYEAAGGKGWSQMKVVEEALSRHLEEARAGGAPEPSVAETEHYLDQYSYHWISSAFHRDFFSISCVVAYLWMLFFQIRNLFKIIEGRRFGFSPEQIMGRIVCNA